MNAYLKILKKELIKDVNKMFSEENQSLIKNQCLDAISCLSLLKSSISSYQFLQNLSIAYRNLVDALKIQNLEIVEKALDYIVKESVYSICFIMNQDKNYLDQFIIWCYQNNMNMPSQVIGQIIGSLISFQVQNNQDFDFLWDYQLKYYFILYNIISSDNLYCKKYILNLISNNQMGEDNKYKFDEIGHEIFGNVRNYKFLVKACALFEKFNQYNSKFYESNEFGLKIKCTKSPIKSQENIEFIFNQSNNNDLLLFGKHEKCKIRLKESNSIDDIAFAIFNKSGTFFIIDCSKEGLLKIKLSEENPLILENDMLIDLAGTELFRIISLYYIVDETSPNIKGEISINFIKGELSSSINNNIFKFEGQTNPDTKILLGRGLINQNIDILFSGNLRIGGKHCCLNFKDNSWKIIDNYSLHGTFALLKNFSQYQNRVFSDPKPLFIIHENL